MLTVRSNTAYEKNLGFADFLEAREAERIAVNRLMTARLKAATHPTQANINKAESEFYVYSKVSKVYLRYLAKAQPVFAEGGVDGL